MPLLNSLILRETEHLSFIHSIDNSFLSCLLHFFVSVRNCNWKHWENVNKNSNPFFIFNKIWRQTTLLVSIFFESLLNPGSIFLLHHHPNLFFEFKWMFLHLARCAELFLSNYSAQTFMIHNNILPRYFLPTTACNFVNNFCSKHFCSWLECKSGVTFWTPCIPVMHLPTRNCVQKIEEQP